MAYNQLEDFVRCLSCGHPWFTEENLHTIQPEPVRMRESEYDNVQPVIKQTKYIYVCKKCGEILDRAKAAKIAEDKRLGRTIVIHTPPPTDDDSSNGNPDQNKPTITI
jgi:hypothetical protein